MVEWIKFLLLKQQTRVQFPSSHTTNNKNCFSKQIPCLMFNNKLGQGEASTVFGKQSAGGSFTRNQKISSLSPGQSNLVNIDCTHTLDSLLVDWKLTFLFFFSRFVCSTICRFVQSGWIFPCSLV